MAEGAAGFWSYVREDDNGDDGRILDLATDLRSQYRMQTGETLELFLDRESIQWGDAWAQRISDAIAGTTFFIPIITPSYFRSNPCRQELLKFVRGATRLGLEQLLMPIYWVTVPALEKTPEESSDEAIRAIAKYNRQELREERLEDRGSAPYRKVVHRLAEELAMRTAAVDTVEDVPDESEAALVSAGGEATGNDEPLGILEQLAVSEEAMPRLTEALESIGNDIEAVGGLIEETGTSMEAASARGQGVKAALTLTEKLARKLEAPTARIEQRGHEYAATLAELDPGIQTRLDLIAREPDRAEEQTEFLEVVEGLAESADTALNELEAMVREAETASTMSRSLRGPLRRMQTGVQGVLDGRAIIEEWGRRAKELQIPGTGGGDAETDADGGP